MWNLDPPPGFQGLDPGKPITAYQRHLPHWRQDGAAYFATFRLHDSLPQCKLRELEGIRAEWERRHSPPRSIEAIEDITRRVVEQVERWLDEGQGSCVLKEGRLAAHVTAGMHHFDGERYELDCYCVMPNHVHVIVRPLFPDAHALEDILGAWRLFSSRRINKELRRSGTLWQEESFDRIIRDAEHLYRAIQYIGSNPDKAALPRDACPLWIRPQWEALGWTFEWRKRDREAGQGS